VATPLVILRTVTKVTKGLVVTARPITLLGATIPEPSYWLEITFGLLRLTSHFREMPEFIRITDDINSGNPASGYAKGKH
jgi:hypothetical protein